MPFTDDNGIEIQNVTVDQIFPSVPALWRIAQAKIARSYAGTGPLARAS
jgi:hypothetical protein